MRLVFHRDGWFCRVGCLPKDRTCRTSRCWGLYRHRDGFREIYCWYRADVDLDSSVLQQHLVARWNQHLSHCLVITRHHWTYFLFLFSVQREVPSDTCQLPLLRLCSFCVLWLSFVNCSTNLYSLAFSFWNLLFASVCIDHGPWKRLWFSYCWSTLLTVTLQKHLPTTLFSGCKHRRINSKFGKSGWSWHWIQLETKVSRIRFPHKMGFPFINPRYKSSQF